MKPQRIRVAFCASLLLHLLSSPNVHGGQWETKVVGRLAEFPTVTWPQVSDGRVAWTGGYGNDSEVFVYENGISNRVSNDHLRDTLIDIAGNHVAWSEDLPSQNGRETVNLILDGKTIAEGLPYENASLSSTGLAWADVSNSKICFYDGLETHTFAYPGTSANYNPNASGSRVVWSGFDPDVNNRAYFYDGTQVLQLPEPVGIGQTPHIDGDHVTGILVNDSDHTIGVTRYNIATGQLDTFPSEVRFTNTPYISGAQMAWTVELDDKFELFALDSQGTPVQLTDTGYKSGPYVSDSFVVWTGANPQGGIFTFDGKSITKVPSADAVSVVTDADKNSLVWLQPNGLNYDIVLATYAAPEPSSIVMAGIAVASGVCLMRKYRKRGSHPDIAPSNSD